MLAVVQQRRFFMTLRHVRRVIVWGDYGRMDHKSFMGVAQILLEELDLSSTRNWLVQVVPTFLPGGSHTSLPHQASFPVLSGQLLRAPRGAVVVDQ